MLFSIHKNIAYVFLFTLALTSTNSFGMQEERDSNAFGYTPFSSRPCLWQQQLPSIPAHLTHNMHSQFGNIGETTSSHIAPHTQVFNNCTFNFGQQNPNYVPKKKGRGPGKKSLLKQEGTYAFDLDEAYKSVDTARQSGKYELSALMDACSQEYIDLTKDESTSHSDQESDGYSDSEESEEEELLTRGDTGYSLRNVERLHWGATTMHEIPEIKSEFISADENSECEDDKKITNKPKVSKVNKVKVLRKRAKKSRSGRKIKTPNRLADMEMVGTQYIEAH